MLGLVNGFFHEGSDDSFTIRLRSAASENSIAKYAEKRREDAARIALDVQYAESAARDILLSTVRVGSDCDAVKEAMPHRADKFEKIEEMHFVNLTAILQGDEPDGRYNTEATEEW